MRTIKVFIAANIYLALLACQNAEESSPGLDQGYEVYLTHCISCHGADGMGYDGTYPRLANRTMTPIQTQHSIELLLNGSVGMKRMPLEEEEIEDVMAYIQNAWNHKNE